jgi:type III secretion protein S
MNNALIELMHRGMVLLMMTAAPAVITAAVVGLVVAVVQAATQIQDQSISQSMKLGAVVVVLLVTGSWIGAEVLRFGQQLLESIPVLTR